MSVKKSKPEDIVSLLRLLFSLIFVALLFRTEDSIPSISETWKDIAVFVKTSI